MTAPAHATEEAVSVVEHELRDIALALASGRMNVFGTQQTHDDIIKELRKVSDLQTQVFFKSSARLRGIPEEENAFDRALNRQVGAAPAGAQGNVGDTTPSRVGGAGGADDSKAGGHQPQQQPAHQSVDDITDASFADVAKVFKQKEAVLRSIGDNVKQMSRHVQNVNETIQRLPK